MTDDKGAGDSVTIHAHSKAVECEECAYRKGYSEGRASVEKYTVEMLKFATDEVKKCHEQIRQLEEKYARNVYVMPPGKPSFDQKEHDVLVEKGTKAWGG